jgi:hypothetical protein
MFFLNLSLAQFLGLLGAGSALVVALYLLDRSRRREVVSTLQFWIAARRAPETRRRRRIQQWPSLVLQLLSLALLLAALGDLRVGQRGAQYRDHVLVLDTSAWMAARFNGHALIEQARELARAWLRRLPAGDRVMLVRADALATPATPFTTDRALLDQAIARSEPSATALRLDRALAFADHARRGGGSAGEIVLIGAGRIVPEGAGETPPLPGALRFLEVRGDPENCGLRDIVLQRTREDPSVWQVLVKVRNYGQREQVRRLALAFGGAPVGSALLRLPPDSEQEVSFLIRARAAGWLEVRLLGRDALSQDDEAVLELPAVRPARVLVYTRQPELFRPLFSASPWVRAEFRSPEAYQAGAPGDVVVLDRFCPPAPPQAHSIWLDPPLEGAPVAVRHSLAQAPLARWRTDHPVAAGLRTRDLMLTRVRVLAPAPGDVPVAEVEAGPVILARAAGTKMLVFGFHPLATAMRYEVTLPLLIANALRWMVPEAFARQEVRALSAGTLTLELGEEEAQGVRVVGDDGRTAPFTLEQNKLELFVSTPRQVRVLTSAGERVLSLTLPEVAAGRWKPPAGIRRGLPSGRVERRASLALWPWLALASGVCLWLEALLYGRLVRTSAVQRKRFAWHLLVARWRQAGGTRP